MANRPAIAAENARIDRTPNDRWLQTPAVREWRIYAEGKPSDSKEPGDSADPSVRMWVVSDRVRPFAFMQDYDPHASANHDFRHLPHGSRGIAQFIGEPDMIGRDHGSSFIQAGIDALSFQGVLAIGTDPHPHNMRKIRAHEEFGFVGRGYARVAGSSQIFHHVPVAS